MRLVDHYLQPALTGRPGWQLFLLRVLLAAVATASAVGLGAMAMLFNTAPAWLSMMLEPLCLLLMPGMAVSLAIDSAHDLDPNIILDFSVLFYFVVFLAVLEWRAWRSRRKSKRFSPKRAG